MCRLFGIISDHECMDRISDKIEQFRTFAKNNPDGWGLGYYENGNAKIVKHPRNALKDPTFLPIIDDVISNISIIHLRKRSIGEKTMVNTHPFAQGDLIFAHNGTIRTASPMKICCLLIAATWSLERPIQRHSSSGSCIISI